MMTTQQTATLNGWDVAQFEETIETVRQQPEAGLLTWRNHVDWDDRFATDARTDEIEQLGQSMPRKFTLRGDHPPELLGDNTGPTAVEALLAALGSCIAGTYAAHATARGIEIEALRVDLEARIDLAGLFQLRPVDAGLTDLGVTVRVKSDAGDAELRELLEITRRASPVFDTVARPVRVEAHVTRS